ncbi:Methane monooxygenase component A beta chain [Gossypium arboreum]|uniref:Methane monooxygenase component A beta chain n=1 Tax=Gossypium arboreum TaxID=29729 RepID=A0A0B0MD12_GOSAR|nr:Methane monooxygenase component A beta chain [Gossypium arboreum]
MDTLYNNMKVEMDDLKKCYDPKESEKYSTEMRNWLGSSSLTVAQFYKQFIHVVSQIPFRVLEFLTSSSDGEQLMNAIIRFIDDTVITPAEDRWISSFD